MGRTTKVLMVGAVLLVVTSALLSAAAQTTLPSAWTHGFRVGPGWVRGHP